MPGTSAPAGYLVCDGSAVTRDTYPALFAAIGTTWGSGDGDPPPSTCPNLQSRFRWGAGGDQNVGSVGGEEDLVLNTSHMPAHTHSDGTLATTSAGSHVHGNRQYAGGNSGGAEYDIAQAEEELNDIRNPEH